ncbi:MAG: hypothetical protein KF887_10240 [Paracoccaceae bacterium]|nr:MAG: hypothetical protein KF887_10240 [Paracoccaceae bacterium]
MTDPIPPRKATPRPPDADPPRADRLKAALKANMARRKAQARARADKTADPEDGTDGQDNR